MNIHINKKNNIDKNIILMRNMKPCSIGIIETKGISEYGHIVMRTADHNKFEVLDLSDFSKQNYTSWTRKIEDIEDIQVKILDETQYKITIDINI